MARGLVLVPWWFAATAPGQALLIGPDQWNALRAQITTQLDAKLADQCTQWATDLAQTESRCRCAGCSSASGCRSKKTLVTGERDLRAYAGMNCALGALAGLPIGSGEDVFVTLQDGTLLSLSTDHTLSIRG